jgi:hypothetical protein
MVVLIAPDGASCECGMCECGELAELDLRRPGKRGDSELLCVECLAKVLRSWVSLHDILGRLTA